MTTYTLERADTGEHLDAYQIRDEADRLDGAATDGCWRVGDPWTPGPGMIPAHPERMRKPRNPHHDMPARDYAALIGQARITRDRSAIRDVYAHMDVATDHLHHEATDWKDLAFLCEQLHAEPGPQCRDVTTPLMQAYERERDALVRGLRGPEYGGHVYDPEPRPAPETEPPATPPTQSHRSWWRRLLERWG